MEIISVDYWHPKNPCSVLEEGLWPLSPSGWSTWGSASISPTMYILDNPLSLQEKWLHLLNTHIYTLSPWLRHHLLLRINICPEDVEFKVNENKYFSNWLITDRQPLSAKSTITLFCQGGLRSFSYNLISRLCPSDPLGNKGNKGKFIFVLLAASLVIQMETWDDYFIKESILSHGHLFA